MQEREFELKGWQNAVSGGLAGVLARMFVAPLDVVKIRLQVFPLVYVCIAPVATQKYQQV